MSEYGIMTKRGWILDNGWIKTFPSREHAENHLPNGGQITKIETGGFYESQAKKRSERQRINGDC